MDIIVDTQDREKYFWARYFLECSTNILEGAKELAIGQSIGNPNARSVWETKEMFDNHCAKILKSKYFGSKMGEVLIGFPYDNIDFETDGVSQLLCMLMGGQMDIDNIYQCHLLELDLKEGVLGRGPKYGITGIRDWTGARNRPLLGGIIKPKTGITPLQLLDMTKELVEGGVDFIKEDEILGNPQVCPFEERVGIINNYLIQQNRNIVYSFCVNGDLFGIEDKLWKIDRVVNTYPLGAHINIWSGLGTYKSARDHEYNLFYHYQKSGDKVITSKNHAYRIDWKVLCYLAGLSGVDTIHAGMIGGYLNDDEEDIKESINILRKQNVLPALSCGMKPDLVGPITEKIGIDWMANVGGFIHSDPQGSKAGTMKMRKAIEACSI